MFIGGLDYSTTDEGLKQFYEKWGTVVDVVVMKEPKTRRSRGFGFITYSKAEMVDRAMNNRPHKIDGRQVEPKRAVPRDLCSKGEANVRKLFIGGIGKAVTKEDLAEYFGKYGTLTDCAIVVTKDTGEPRGFGFVEYEDVDSADKVILIRDHEVKGRRVEIKKAIAREEINKDGRRGGGRGHGGMRDGRGGDFRNGQGNFGGWNNGQGNSWGINNPSPWNNQQVPPMGNFGGGWNNQGNNCGMNTPNPWNNQQGLPMGNFGSGWNNQGNNCGLNNPSPWNNQQGPPMGNWGGNNPWGSIQNGCSQGYNGSGIGDGGYPQGNQDGRLNNVENSLGSSMNNLRNVLGNAGTGGSRGSDTMGSGGTGIPNNIYSVLNTGGMGFNNFGGPSGGGGGGPMRNNYGSSNNRSAPYPTSGGMNDRRGGGGGGGQFSNYHQ
ncbi:hypothetical protein RUM43_007524 [Polyplax serrata]|uniref:RRM domain-containing protein n=1 Tax=Polyplax serrata TaxID=468196 RepID=A0AAN8Q654_POLSC